MAPSFHLPLLAAAHTILLLQPGKSPNSRTFADFPSPAKAADGAIGMFEDSLKERHRAQQHISYSAQDLHAWLDRMPQVGALVFDGKLQAYVPYDKEWVKAQTLQRLQRAAGVRG